MKVPRSVYGRTFSLDQNKLQDKAYLEFMMDEINTAMNVLWYTYHDQTDKNYREGMRYYIRLLNTVRNLYYEY